MCVLLMNTSGLSEAEMQQLVVDVAAPAFENDWRLLILHQALTVISGTLINLFAESVTLYVEKLCCFVCDILLLTLYLASRFILGSTPIAVAVVCFFGFGLSQQGSSKTD